MFIKFEEVPLNTMIKTEEFTIQLGRDDLNKFIEIALKDKPEGVKVYNMDIPDTLICRVMIR